MVCAIGGLQKCRKFIRIKIFTNVTLCFGTSISQSVTIIRSRDASASENCP